jgi:hypothetical protein
LAKGKVDVSRNIDYIFFIAIKDFLGFTVFGVMLLDVDGLQFVVHPFSKTESFDHRVFVNAPYGCHGLGVLFQLLDTDSILWVTWFLIEEHLYTIWDKHRLSFFERTDFDTFSEVSRNRKILYRIIAALLILLGVAIAIFLIPGLIPLLKRTPYQLLHPELRVRNALSLDWFWQSVGWFIVYMIFRIAKSFYKDSQKPTSTFK